MRLFGAPLDLGSGTVRVVPPCPAMLAAKSQLFPVNRHESQGDPTVREQFVQLLDKMSGVTVPAQNVVTTPAGSSSGLGASLVHAMNRSDGGPVVNFVPSWFGYPGLAQAHNIPMVYVETEEHEGHVLTPELLDYTLDRYAPSGVIINNLATPTGAFITKERLRDLASVLQRYPGVMVIEDALFLTTRYNGQFPLILDVAPWLLEDERYIGTTSLAKGWAPQDDVLGFLWTDPRSASEIAWSIRMYFDRVEPDDIRAARGALSDEGMRTPVEVNAGLEANLAELLKLFDSLNCGGVVTVPEGGTNVLWDIRSLGVDDFQFCRWVQHHTGVSLAAGSRFAARGHVRVNLGGATPENFRKACERLYELLRRNF